MVTKRNRREARQYALNFILIKMMFNFLKETFIKQWIRHMQIVL